MGKETGISWASHTANFWWGCMKVSPGCKHCYAETLSNRYGKSIWGVPSITERELKKGVWKDILQWDKDAKQANERRRVFVMSMGDFLEDHPQVYQWREDAKRILENLQWLDVLMLTKRPENANVFLNDWANDWPSHVWLGTSVENQEQAEIRVPHLLETNAKIKFLSCEPLLGGVNLLFLKDTEGGTAWIDCLNRKTGCPGFGIPLGIQDMDSGINWVICGGESGNKARPMNVEWARSLRDQCVSANVPFFFKQMGGKDSRKGGNLLDGEVWQQFPSIGGD